MYKVGDVLKATKAYTSTGTDAKNRWFVCLGRVNFTRIPRNVFLCTTTTQIQRYEGTKKSSCVFFSSRDTCFTDDCLLCLDEIEDAFTEEEFNEKYNPEFRGRLSDGKLKEIARKLAQADIPKAVMNDILDSFRKDGIATR